MARAKRPKKTKTTPGRIGRAVRSVRESVTRWAREDRTDHPFVNTREGDVIIGRVNTDMDFWNPGGTAPSRGSRRKKARRSAGSQDNRKARW